MPLALSSTHFFEASSQKCVAAHSASIVQVIVHLPVTHPPLRQVVPTVHAAESGSPHALSAPQTPLSHCAARVQVRGAVGPPFG